MADIKCVLIRRDFFQGDPGAPGAPGVRGPPGPQGEAGKRGRRVSLFFKSFYMVIIIRVFCHVKDICFWCSSCINIWYYII